MKLTRPSSNSSQGSSSDERNARVDSGGDLGTTPGTTLGTAPGITPGITPGINLKVNSGGSSKIGSSVEPPCDSEARLAESCLTSLESYSVRPTRQRRTIVRHIFASTSQHFSAEQLHYKIRQENHKISLATVYNTLGLLTRHGWLKPIILGKGSTVFDSNVSYHHHLYNVETQELSDIASIPIGELPSLPADVCLERVEVVVRVRPKQSP